MGPALEQLSDSGLAMTVEIPYKASLDTSYP